MPGHHIRMRRKDMPYSVWRKEGRVTAAIFHTLIWEKRAEKHRRKYPVQDRVPGRTAELRRAAFMKCFHLWRNRQKMVIHRKWQARNQKRVSGFVFICKILKNVFCRYFQYLLLCYESDHSGKTICLWYSRHTCVLSLRYAKMSVCCTVIWIRELEIYRYVIIRSLIRIL